MNTDYLRVERALHYLEEHFLDQPSLDEVASHLNLSPFHFHRLFRRWAGVSPKRFLQFLTLDHAKTLLEESRSILDVTYASGLSSPGRLHDLFVTLDAVTPGEFKSEGAGVEILYGLHPSPFGECLLAVTDRGVCALAFVTSGGREAAVEDLRSRWRQARILERPRATKPVAERIFRPDGPDGGRPVKVFLRGTNFQIKVWEALLRIPPGAVSSYADIARALEAPRAARAVGNAVAANPVAYLIPCHRVLRKMGDFGGYLYGSARKKAMVGWEAARRDVALREAPPSPLDESSTAEKV